MSARKTGPSKGADARHVAELRKLAHTLDVEVERLDMVAALAAEDLRALRAQVGESLFQADRHYFARVAALSKAVPGAVAAKLTQLALPPLIAARTAELLEPARAADLVGRISDSYLADVSAFMDASRSPEVIAAIPAERIAMVGKELARREEWIVIGGFVSQVTSESLRVTVATYSGEQLLRIGFVLDDLTRLDEIGGMLTDRQIDEILVAAAGSQLWAELGELVDHLSGDRLTRMATRFASAPDAVTDAFGAAADRGLLSSGVVGRLRGQ